MTKPTILIVDDTPNNISLLTGLLKESYKVRMATSGEKALRLAAAEPKPDLILLDVMMPGLDGYEVCRKLKEESHTADIPVIFLTAKTSSAEEQLGLELGAVDYVGKPISPPILMARVRTHLRLKVANDLLRGQNEALERRVEERTRQLSNLQDVVFNAMGSLAETRDNETGNHIRRTQNYVRLLAEHLAPVPEFAAELLPETIDLLVKSAPLHDIGKVGVPDHILLKPGRLTVEEFEVMKRHTVIGRDAIQSARKQLPSGEDAFLDMALCIAHGHHEKWDGSGYPEGLRGEEIPLAARIMAVADVYDALTSHRVYKAPMPHEQAVAIIQAGSGGHFDSRIVAAFLELEARFIEVARQYQDGPEACGGSGGA